MALGPSGVWEVNNKGIDTNGGGVNPLNLHYNTDLTYPTSQPTVFSASLGCANTTTLNNKGPSIFTVAMSGNYLRFAPVSGVFEVVTVASSSQITLDRAPGTFQNKTGTVGGSLASPGAAASGMVSGNLMWVKNAPGWYGINTATNNTPGGCVSLPAGSFGWTTRMIGYNAARGDISGVNYANTPYIQISGTINTFNVITTSSDCDIENLTVDCASKTASLGFNIGLSRVNNCFCKNATALGFSLNTGSTTLNCATSGCTTTGGFQGGMHINALAIGNTIYGFLAGNYINCIAAYNTGASTNGFESNFGNLSCVGCEAYYNGKHGFDFSTSVTLVIQCVDCYAEGHTAGSAAGFNASSYWDGVWLTNCGAFNNSTNVVNIPAGNVINFRTLGSSPVTNVGPDTINLIKNTNNLLLGNGARGNFSPTLITASSSYDIGATQRFNLAAAQSLLFRGGNLAGGFSE